MPAPAGVIDRVAEDDVGELASVSTQRLGRVLGGKWRLDALLGAGGTGTVYRASGPEGQGAAVKLLHREFSAEDSVRARFVREAYVANRIDHPGVVRILEDGVDSGLPYLVMELLEGETLEARHVRKGGKLPISEVLWMADRTLLVLAAAHDKGIVHRDVKPENLFLTCDRRLKVLDFGIARLGGGRSETQVGTILGTLAFMPPEQARGDVGEVGVRSDLWSVGATMFTLLSGRLVREDADIGKLLREAGRAKVPSLREVAPELPKVLVDLVDYALSLESDARWASARTMRSAVRLVHAQIKRPSARPADVGEDDAPVSEPSFDYIPNTSLEPPPVSRVLEPQDVLPVSRLPPPPADLAAALSRESLTDTRPSATDASRARSASALAAIAGASGSPVGALAPAAPAAPVRAAARTVPAWMIAAGAALVAAVVLLALLLR